MQQRMKQVQNEFVFPRFTIRTSHSEHRLQKVEDKLGGPRVIYTKIRQRIIEYGYFACVDMHRMNR